MILSTPTVWDVRARWVGFAGRPATSPGSEDQSSRGLLGEKVTDMKLVRGSLAFILVSTITLAVLSTDRATAQTEGSATLQVTTVAANQEYDPRHIFAVWVG